MPQTMAEAAKRFTGETTAPKDACVFAWQGGVRFATGEGGDENRFSIEAYDGRVIPDHWYWGNLAFDLEGLAFASEPLPVLDSHWTSSRLGVTTKQKIGRKVTFEGRFLGNPDAQQLRGDMQDGFPMQASLSLIPRVIERVMEGASVKVNGHTLKGPGVVFRKALIDEVSMCVFGAVPNTRSTAFADNDRQQVQFSVIGKDITMTDENQATVLTAESFKAEHSEVYQAVFEAGKAEGLQAEKNRFAALKQACGEDRELLVTAFAEGRDESWALREANGRLSTRLKAAHEQLAKPPAGGTKPQRDTATQEFIEQPAPEAQESGPVTFMEAVKAHQAEFKVSEAEAVRKCVDLYPDLHAKMQDGK